METLLGRVFERCLLSAISVLRYPTSLPASVYCSQVLPLAYEDRKHVLLKQLRAVFFSKTRVHDVESGFAQALRRRVHLLLKEKENSRHENMKTIEQTLIQQAATEANLASHSTFNKSVVRSHHFETHTDSRSRYSPLQTPITTSQSSSTRTPNSAICGSICCHTTRSQRLGLKRHCVFRAAQWATS